MIGKKDAFVNYSYKRVSYFNILNLLAGFAPVETDSSGGFSI